MGQEGASGEWGEQLNGATHAGAAAGGNDDGSCG